jgi:hypothetical protein
MPHSGASTKWNLVESSLTKKEHIAFNARTHRDVVYIRLETSSGWPDRRSSTLPDWWRFPGQYGSLRVASDTSAVSRSLSVITLGDYTPK